VHHLRCRINASKVVALPRQFGHVRANLAQRNSRAARFQVIDG
jgi:hypothetical protein